MQETQVELGVAEVVLDPLRVGQGSENRVGEGGRLFLEAVEGVAESAEALMGRRVVGAARAASDARDADAGAERRLEGPALGRAEDDPDGPWDLHVLRAGVE